MSVNRKSLNFPVIMGSFMIVTSLSSTTLGYNHNTCTETTSALYSNLQDDLWQLAAVTEGKELYEECSNTIAEDSYDIVNKTNEKVVYVDKVKEEMGKIESAFEGFVELSEQGKQEYKETLDALGEPNGMNIFDFV